jgi:hypothetical protein
MKTIVHIISSFLVLFLASCDQECYVKFVDFECNMLDFSIQEEPWNVHETINKDSLGISISMSNEIVKKQNGGCHYTFSINPVRSLSIKALYDYSDDFPAGSDITSLFQQKEYVSSFDTSSFTLSPYTVVFIPVKEYIATLTNGESNYADAYTKFYLQLLDTTSIRGKQKFEIAITLSDSTVLTHQTADLILE